MVSGVPLKIYVNITRTRTATATATTTTTIITTITRTTTTQQQQHQQTCWNNFVDARPGRGAELIHGNAFKTPIITVAGRKKETN